MWKVGDVEPVRVMGAEGYPYGLTSARKTASRSCHLPTHPELSPRQRLPIWNRLCSTQFRFSPTQRDGDRKGPLAMDSKAIRSQRWAEVVASLPTRKIG